MTNRYELPFKTIANTTAPSFNAVFDNTSEIFPFQSTGLREWDGPGSRSVRLAALSTAGADCYFAIGSSDIVANSTESLLLLAGTVEVFSLPRPSNTHICFVSSTDVTVNVTPGYGN